MVAYTAPPIVEAILQITFTSPIDKVAYRKVVKQLKKLYDLHSEIVGKNVNFDLTTLGATVTDTEPKQHYTSHDQTDILSTSPNVLAWSRLAPYCGWDSFSARFERDLGVFYKQFSSFAIERVGLRYINRLDIPRVGNEAPFEDYLNIHIKMPNEWSLISGYGWRFERVFPESNFFAIVQSAIMEPLINGHEAVLLDIEVSSMAVTSSKLNSVKELIGELRNLKNEIFEKAVTAKAKESFEKL